MLPRYRNPSPPDNDDYDLSPTDILYLKPTFSLVPLDLTLEIFHKSLFISPPASEDERQSAKDKSVTTKTQSSKEKEKPEDPDGTTSNSRNVDTSKNIFISKEIRSSRKSRHLQLANTDIDTHESRSVATYKEHSKYDGVSKLRENFEPKIIEHEAILKEKTANKNESHLKHKSIKNEPISDEGKEHDRKRRDKKLKHKKKHLKTNDETNNSDSDVSVASQPKSRHKNSDSRKASRRESHSKGSKKRRRDTSRYDDHDTDCSNSRTGSPHRGSKNSKIDCDSYESDRSNSRTSKVISPLRDSKNYKMKGSGSDSDRSNSRRVPKREIKYDPDFEEAYFKLGSYYCKVCQLNLNSECTYESHMRGKKHKKALNAQMVPEVALSSLNTMSQMKESQRSSLPDMNVEYVIIDDVSKIQNVVNVYNDSPMPGLKYIIEIRTGTDTSYYCELCDSPCMAASIMPHLVGFKHQLKSVKDINFQFYERNQDRLKKEIEVSLNEILRSHERKHGRGRIVVVEPGSAMGYNDHNKAGSSWSFPSFQMKKEMKGDYSDAECASDNFQVEDYFEVQDQFPGSCPEYLDTSKSDYYCKICDSHMNNVNMWQAHIIGKRHLKNLKKTPGEPKSKAKIIKAASNAPSELERMVQDYADEVIVGLDFIRETKSENGILYTCFLCGSSCTLDIMDHLLNVKHRIKYLEKVNSNGSIPNGITSISQLEVNNYTRETLVLNECEKIEKEHGRGKVEVYVSKAAW